MTAIVPVQEQINGVRWGDFDADTVAALSPLEASEISANLLAGLKRASIAKGPGPGQAWGHEEMAVWATYHRLRARGSSTAPPVDVPEEVEVEFEVDEPVNPRPRRQVLRPRRKT